jgi:hypothetical protein
MMLIVFADVGSSLCRNRSALDIYMRAGIFGVVVLVSSEYAILGLSALHIS